jgi:hypothetical protein
MSTIELAEELNQQRRRFSTTAAMTAETAELAFVRGAVASSVLGRARALVLSGYPVSPDPTKHLSMEARRLSSLA